jgi:Putative ATPase subunit of terminase (gpP-like)
VDDLVGAAEIADRLGATLPQTVHKWRERYPDDFPQPVAKLRQAMVWAWPDVEAWARRTGRL